MQINTTFLLSCNALQQKRRVPSDQLVTIVPNIGICCQIENKYDVISLFFLRNRELLLSSKHIQFH